MSTEFNFQNFLENLGEYKTRSYSGRAMYGEACLAITVDNTLQAMQDIAFELGKIVGEWDDDNVPCPIERLLRDELRDIRSDSMGRDSQVIYWPNMPYEATKSDFDDRHCDEDCDEECPQDEDHHSRACNAKWDAELGARR